MTRHPQSADAPEAKKRTLSAERVVAKARALMGDQEQRIQWRIEAASAEVIDVDHNRIKKWLNQVQEGAERKLCLKMLDAAGIDVSLWEEQPAAPESIAPASDDVPSRPSLEEYDGVPERLREPLSPERLAVARGRK